MTDTLSAEARESILAMIKERLREPGARLPTDRELAREGRASYATIRLVMKQLERDGFIRRIRGSGTYVAPGALELLQRRDWKTLLLFAPPVGSDPERDFGAFFLREVRSAAEKASWRVELLPVSGHDAFLRELAKRWRGADAVAYLPPGEPFSMRQLGQLDSFGDKPLAILDMELPNVSICNITSDNRRGGALAARQLLENGFRAPLLLICEPRTRQLESRILGFCETLEPAGIRPEVLDCRVAPGDSRPDLARKCLRRYLKEGRGGDAVFALSDSGAFGAAEAIRESGREIGLIGFDGLPAGCATLATIEQPVREIATALFDLFAEWREGKSIQLQLLPRFRPGESLSPSEKGAAIC